MDDELPTSTPVVRPADEDIADAATVPDLILAELPVRADDVGPYCGPIIERA